MPVTDEFGLDDPNPYLYVAVIVLDRNLPIVSTVKVQLKQTAMLAANREIRFAITWKGSGITVSRRASEARARDTIRNVISENVDIFSNDYLAVNPQP